MKYSKPIFALFGVAAILSLLVSVNSNAFWSVNLAGDSSHSEITATGLSAVSGQCPEGGSCSLAFHSMAVEKIIKGNEDEDFVRYIATAHFDNESFIASFDRIKGLRAKLIESLVAYDAETTILDEEVQKKAWTRLGALLHTLQDFYSHSTITESNGAAIIQFGELTRFGVASGLPGANSIQFCDDADGTNRTNQSNELTTGYYLAEFPSLPQGKCRHGNLKYHIARLSSACTLLNQGINHDYSCQAGYWRARRLAISSTHEMVQSIVDELEEKQAYDGICLLLGQENNFNCQDFSGLYSVKFKDIDICEEGTLTTEFGVMELTSLGEGKYATKFNSTPFNSIVWLPQANGGLYTDAVFSHPEDGGTTKETLHATISTGGMVSGQSTWSWTDDQFVCQGTTEYSGSKN